MNCTTNTYASKTGDTIFYYHWETENSSDCRGIVQIAHGIGEHSKRYESIANILQNQGFEVYANDHKAHGKTAGSKEKFGYYNGKNYFEDAIEDMHALTILIQQEHPNKKIVLLGHSMGSLLGRKYVTKYGNDIHAFMLSGTASFVKGLGNLGITAASTFKFFNGRSKENKVLNAFFFNELNKKFKPTKTKLDWISSDEKEVAIFEADPYRVEDFSLGILLDVIKGSKEVNKQAVFNATPKELPIYIFSGDKDPLGEMGKGILRIVKQYEKAGIADVTLKLYKNGRHEMLNEVNKEEVTNDMMQWLLEKIN